MHITLAYWISGLSEESPHAIHFYSIKGHACDHHKKKTSCKSSSIQIWIFGAHSWVGSRRKTRGGVLFDKTYSSLVLFPLLTRWGPIMIPVKNQSRSKDWLKTDWHAVISANSHCTVVMHFGKLLGARLCGVIDDDAWPPWVKYLAELLCGGKIFKLAPFVTVRARKQHLTATGARGWWHSVQETNKQEAERRERTLLNHIHRIQGSEGR